MLDEKKQKVSSWEGPLTTSNICELLKQYVSILQVINRNQSPQCNLKTLQNDKISLPFILIKFLPQAHYGIIQTPNGMATQISSDKMFDVMNENALFEGMGLTKINVE